MSWRVVEIGDLIKNFSVKAKDYNIDVSKLEFFGVSNTEGIVKSKQAAKDKANDYKILERTCFAYNPYRVNVGSIAMLNEDVVGLISPAYVVFKVKPKSIIPQLLLKYLKSTEGLRQIKLHARGTVRQALRFADLCKIKIALPDYNEQLKFYEAISKTEIESSILSSELNYQLSLLTQLRQAFLRKAMQGKLVEQDPSDEPASELLARIKAEKEKLIKEKKLKRGKVSSQSMSLINELIIPKSWTWTKTDNIFFVTKLAGFEYTQYISLQPSGEVPVIRAQNVRPYEIKKTNLLYIDIKTSELLERCALTKEVLLVTFIGAGIGDVARFHEKERWHLAPNVAKMEPFEECDKMMNLKFINYFLMSDNGKAEIFKHVKATAQPSLSMGTIRDIDIPLPPLSEQKRIVAELDELMTYCDQLEESIKNSQTQNEMLLGQMLREALEPEKNMNQI